jgi:CubicO group peptidase (beta-lactamase class C family)
MVDPDLADAAAAGFDAGVLQRLRARIQADVDSGLIAGAVTLVMRRGEPVLHWSQGWREAGQGAPLAADSVFWIASMTKPVTCAAALALVDDGMLDLDAPVAGYLPAFRNCEAVDQPGRPVGRHMTVRDLMRHTAGFTYGPFGDTPVHRAYVEQGVYRFDQRNAEMAARLAALPLLHVPGSTFEYGMSTDVLGHLLELAAGEPLDALVARRITGPLGMHDTHFRLPPAALPRVASALPHENMAMRPPPSPPPAWMSGGAGLWSTAADYARFAAMLCQGGQHQGRRVLREASVREMLSPQLGERIGFGSYVPALGAVAPTRAMAQNFGLGVSVRQPGEGNPLPGTPGDFTWPGLSGCNFWCDPARRLVVVQMLQAPSQRYAYRALLRQAVYGALATGGKVL